MKASKYVSLLFVVTTFSLVIGYAYAQESKTLPKGNWTFSAGPYSGKDADDLPLVVRSVTTDSQKGFGVSKIKLGQMKTDSKDREVAKFKLKWFLTDEDTGNMIQSEESALCDFNKRTSENQIVLFDSLFSFSKVSLFEKKAKKLVGNFRLEVVVSYVEYKNQMAWNFMGRIPVDPNKLQEAGCADQGCIWNNNINTYQCGGTASSSGAFCSVGADGQNCLQTRCKTPNEEMEIVIMN